MLSRAVRSDSLWPHYCSLPGSSVYGIFQARILVWVTVSSRGFWQPTSPALAGAFFITEPPGRPRKNESKKIKPTVQFSHSVMSDSLRPHELQHARPPCPSPTPGVDPNSCPLSQWCQPTISSSVVPFSSCLQSFPASGSFQVSQFFTSGGQSIGVSASASVFLQDWFPLGWLIGSPSSPRNSQESSPTS